MKNLFSIILSCTILVACKTYVIDRTYISGGGDEMKVTYDGKNYNGIDDYETYAFYKTDDQYKSAAFNSVKIITGHKEYDDYEINLHKSKLEPKLLVNKYIYKRNGFLIVCGILNFISAAKTSVAGIINGILFISNSGEEKLVEYYDSDSGPVMIKLILDIKVANGDIMDNPKIVENLPPNFFVDNVSYKFPSCVKSVSQETKSENGKNLQIFTINSKNGKLKKNATIKIIIEIRIKFD